MTVEQLIDELSKVDDKSQKVYYLDGYGEEYHLVNYVELSDEDSGKPKLIIS